jgi:hypothetical protein
MSRRRAPASFDPEVAKERPLLSVSRFPPRFPPLCPRRKRGGRYGAEVRVAWGDGSSRPHCGGPSQRAWTGIRSEEPGRATHPRTRDPACRTRCCSSTDRARRDTSGRRVRRHRGMGHSRAGRASKSDRCLSRECGLPMRKRPHPAELPVSSQGGIGDRSRGMALRPRRGRSRRVRRPDRVPRLERGSSTQVSGVRRARERIVTAPRQLRH